MPHSFIPIKPSGKHIGVTWGCVICKHQVHLADGYEPKSDEKVTVIHLDTMQHFHYNCEEYQVYKTMRE